MEEEIQHLEQKLKIAKRKGRKGKLKKLIVKPDKLSAGIVVDQYAGEERGIVGGVGTTETVAPTPSRAISGIESEPILATITEDNGMKASEIGGPAAIAPSTTPSTTNAALFRVKDRRSENSMIFPLDPRAIKTAAVFDMAPGPPLESFVISMQAQTGVAKVAQVEFLSANARTQTSRSNLLSAMITQSTVGTRTPGRLPHVWHQPPLHVLKFMWIG
ncbi:hypothetical protein HK104_000260 [Borealophlyctis nickersoniae]|nr:hypothetical protein HK104_000260 [Borealophlyctis nickersoniae]